jgi:hypothetical protein
MSANGHHPQPAQAVQGNDGNGLRHPSERQAFWDVNSQKRTPGVSRQRISLNVRQAPSPMALRIRPTEESGTSSSDHTRRGQQRLSEDNLKEWWAYHFDTPTLINSHPLSADKPAGTTRLDLICSVFVMVALVHEIRRAGELLMARDQL